MFPGRSACLRHGYYSTKTCEREEEAGARQNARMRKMRDLFLTFFDQRRGIKSNKFINTRDYTNVGDARRDSSPDKKW